MNPPVIALSVTRPDSYSTSVDLYESLLPAGTIPERLDPCMAALTHEIRNPLSTIKLAAEMLRSIMVDDYQVMYLDIILRGSAHIDDILADLLASPVISMQPERHSIHQLLDEAMAMVEDQATLKGITVRKEYTKEDFRIATDRPGIKIALTNIIVNAIDAMTTGKGELKLVTKSVDGKLVVRIEDNGCGISEKNLKHIYEPYFTKKASGLGLGLATTYTTLKSNHVGIDVESEVGLGTCFILSFE